MQSNCTICQDLFDASVGTVATKCGHIFHNNCINQWLTQSYTCPECRSNVSDNSLTKLFFRDISDYNMEKSLDSLKERLNDKDLEIVAKDRKIHELITTYKNSSRDIDELHEKHDDIQKHIFAISSELEVLSCIRIKNLKLLEENKNLQSETSHLKNVKTIVGGCFHDAEKILADVQIPVSSEEEKVDSRRIAAYCCEMKQELTRSKKEQTQLQDTLMELKRKMEVVRAEHKRKRKQHFNVSMNSSSESASCSRSPIPITPGASNDLSFQSSNLAVSTSACCSSDHLDFKKDY